MTLKKRIQQLEKSGNISNSLSWGELIRRINADDDLTTSELEKIFPGKNYQSFEEVFNDIEKQNKTA